VYCWGNNDYGQLGLPLDTASVTIPTRVTGLPRPAAQIGMGVQGNLSCALLDDTTVWCWGHTAFGAAGHDPTPDPACAASKCNPEPKVVADSQGRPLSGVARIAVGRSVACALTQLGSLMCWGLNAFGTLGNGTADSAAHASPQLVSGLPPVTSLSLGDLTVLATDSNGAVWGWGRNNYGAIGDGTITGNAPIDGGVCSQACRWRPTRANVSDVRQITIRGNTSIALGTNGALWVWGQNAAGELGHSPGTAADVMCGADSTPWACDPRPTMFDFVPVIPPAPLPAP
jgi:alpha-tubulin suppressor-like RCC1 family protein